MGTAGGILEPPGSASLLRDASVVRGQYRTGAVRDGSIAREFFRRRLRALGRPDGHLAASNWAGPDAAHPVRRRAAQYPVSKSGAGALLYNRPAAPIHDR